MLRSIYPYGINVGKVTGSNNTKESYLLEFLIEKRFP